MLVIIEGPDGSGKTTLASRLADHLDAEVHHHGPYRGEKEVAHHYWRSIDAARLEGQKIVMDRSWISEPIYGKHVRSGLNRVSLDARRALERGALSAGGVVVRMAASFDFCSRNWADRTGRVEYVRSANQFRRIWADYRDLEPGLPVVAVDPEEDHPAGFVADRVLEVSLPNLGPGSGCFRRGCVLVVTGPVVPLASGRPHEIVAFEELQVPEMDMYWVQAGASTGFLEVLEPRHVVAVGPVAAEWTAEARTLDFEQVARLEDLAAALNYVPQR